MYHALYRKYRPSDFDSVVGQNSIIKTLKNSIINNNFSHAYMFTGPRGTGKTTVSKIFARNVNCLSPKDGIACKKCDACNYSFSNECLDIIEIDAASNNGVNEIRELRNNVALVPSELKYKIYIVDEVHMLSDAAFNALLKTLEEPPEHVIFILATTDPQKLPETIISRCQCFSFKRISDEVIFDRLEDICKKEKIKIDSEVLKRIAILSDGGLRDALGSLDKLVSYTNKKITLDDFNEVNGIVSDEEIYSFIKNIILGNIKEVLTFIQIVNSKGKNIIQIMIQTVNSARDIVVDYYLNDIECDISIDLLQLFVNELNEKMNDIKKSSNTKVYIEMFLLKFMNDNIISNNINEKKFVEKGKESFNNSSKIILNNNDFLIKSNSDEIQEKILDHNNESSERSEKIETVDLNDSAVVEKNINSITNYDNKIPKILNIKDIMKVRINNTMATADKQLLKSETNLFEELRDYSFDSQIGYIVNSLLDSKLRAVGKDNLIISYDSDANVDQNLINIILINDVYNKITKSDKNIAIVTDDEWDNLKNDYINHLKNNISYDILEEPEVVLEEIKNDDIISSSAISLFGEDIVEIE